MSLGPDKFWRTSGLTPHSHPRSLDAASPRSEEKSNGHKVQSCELRLKDREGVGGHERGRLGRGDASVPRATSVR